MHARKPVWKTSSFLVYTGGLTVLVGGGRSRWRTSPAQFGKGALTGWALLMLVVLRLLAEALRLRGRWVAGGIFSFASVIAWGVFLGARVVVVRLAPQLELGRSAAGRSRTSRSSS